MTDHSHWIQSALAGLTGSSLDSPTWTQIAAGIQAASTDELELLCIHLLENAQTALRHPQRVRSLMQQIASRLIAIQNASAGRAEEDSSPLPAELISRLYESLAPVDHIAAAHAMQCLAVQEDSDSTAALARILEENPPQKWQFVGLGLSPLWNASRGRLGAFFDSMGEDSTQQATLPVLLDLANYSVRNGRLKLHPFRRRAASLGKLLSDLTVRLEKLESDPSRYGERVDEIQQVLSESVALCLSICDALGLMGQSSAIDCLVEAMELSHRRIQVEAAAALVRLDDPRGKQRLIELASDRVARCRVVQYAEELGIASEIDEQFRYPQSLAESELAAWLASPEQFGFPPATMECIDCRTQYWPGYEEPRDCYLFRFEYHLAGGDYTNLGIAGPLTHAFPVSLEGMDIPDVYAVFAGWHVEHDEMFEVPIQKLNAAQQKEVRRLEVAFPREGYQVQEAISLGFLLGETTLLARVENEEHCALGITNGDESSYFAVGESPISESPDLVVAYYRGRRLLRAFNG